MPATELSFAARVKGLEQGDLDRALWEEKALTRTWAMRGTLHVIPAAETGLFMAATGREYGPAWMRYFGLTAAEVDAVVSAIGTVLEDGRVRSRKELAADVESIVGDRYHDQLHSGWGAFLKPAAGRGLLVGGPPRGQAVTFTHAGRWLGGWSPPAQAQARAEMVRRYLHAYGPATMADFGRWAGMLPPAARPAWRAVEPEMDEVQVESKKLWLLASDGTAFATAEPQEEIRLVPNFDSYLLSHADREALVEKEFAPRIYRPAAWVWATVLKGGRAVGVWSSKKDGTRLRVEVEEFHGLNRSERREVESEVARLAGYLGLEHQVVVS